MMVTMVKTMTNEHAHEHLHEHLTFCADCGRSIARGRIRCRLCSTKLRMAAVRAARKQKRIVYEQAKAAEDSNG